MILYLWMHWFWITLLWRGALASPPNGAEVASSTAPMATSTSTGEAPPLRLPDAPRCKEEPCPKGSGPIKKVLAPKASKLAGKAINRPDNPLTTTTSSTSTTSSNPLEDISTSCAEDNATTAEEPGLNSTTSATIGTTTTSSTTVQTLATPSEQILMDHQDQQSWQPMGAASITGISLGVVVFASVAGAISVYVYRNRYTNKPQVLTDKCSNPDSSGYIDDSTFKVDSEEMYSLDNDSFLNSLEVMTIHWTDHIKHTKL